MFGAELPLRAACNGVDWTLEAASSVGALLVDDLNHPRHGMIGAELPLPAAGGTTVT